MSDNYTVFMRTIERELKEELERVANSHEELQLKPFLSYIEIYFKTYIAQFVDELASSLKQCESEECNRYFIPVPQGREKRYCSLTCRKREYMREYRKKYSKK